MNIDLSRLPATLDALHLTLAIAVVILSVLFLLVLTLVVIILFKRTAAPAPTLEPRLQVAAEPAVAKEMVEEVVPKAPPKPVILREPTPDAALQLLGLLQSEARFIDFIKEDISSYSDADVGAAARIVHEGCRKVLNDHFEIQPIRPEQEGSRISVAKGFDPAEIRLTGNIVGNPPFNGVLVHRGWRVNQVKLPQLSEGHKVEVIAPAEVEL